MIHESKITQTFKVSANDILKALGYEAQKDQSTSMVVSDDILTIICVSKINIDKIPAK